ncbi:hypothetical protein BH23VER1_BH23VER1_10850 [soil metagenome]
MNLPRQLDLPFPTGPPAGEPRPAARAAHPPPSATRRVTLPSAAALTQLARELAFALRTPELSAKIRVAWNPRLRTTAGRAHYSTSLIELNPRLLVADAAGEIDRTFRHELAHLVAHARTAKNRRIDAHGPEWRQACADLGIPDEARCHTLELAPRRKVARKFAYRCPACETVILRVKKFSRYSACYRCCKSFNGGRYHARFQLRQIPLPDEP